MKIITIDFDIIMEPSIEFYNDIVATDKSISHLTKNFPFLSNLPADLYIYEYLTNYILLCKQFNVNIQIIKDHNQMVSKIKSIRNKYPKIVEDSGIHLINIDHHHDVSYDWDGDQHIIEPAVGNWVKYLKDNKLIDSYYWFNNYNSIIDNKKVLSYIDKISNIKETNITPLAKETVFLFLCKSFEWVPQMYHPLFTVWEDICNEICGFKE